MWKLSHAFEVALFVFIVIIQVNSGCIKPNNRRAFFCVEIIARVRSCLSNTTAVNTLQAPSVLG